jgi:hypothetical protein
MPGGFHPFHAGHASLYQAALKAFPSADVYVAATNDTKTRPFPFAIKEKLAKVAGVAPGHFIQVKSPFQPREITDRFNPEQDVVIFVRSEKDRNETPKPGGRKKDGSPAYFQPWTGKDVEAFGKHAYMAYLPTVEFGPGITSATEIRNAWPTLNDKRKTAMVMSLYPATQKNPKLAANVVKMLDMSMSNEQINEFAPNDGGDDKSYLLQLADDLADAMYGPNKNKQEVKNISGKILAAGGNVKITWNDDSTFNVVMYHPTYFKQGHLIRLVGKGDQEDIAESKERCPQCGMTNCTCSPGKCKCKPIAGWIPNKGFEKQDVAEAEKTARVFHPQYVDVYFLEGSRREPILVNRKVPYHLIDRYLELVVKKYNLQQGRFEFRNAEEEPTKVTESVDYLEEK